MSKQSPGKVIKITPSRQGQTEQQMIAEAVIGSPVQAAMTMSSYLEPPFSDGLNELVGELHRQVMAVNKGDLRNAEGLLMAQAHSLDAIYNRLAQWAMSQADIGHFETLLRLSLRAQSQCARTLEVLSGLKSPNIGIVQQTNVGHNVQVNNGTQAVPPAGQSPVIDSDSDPQLEHIDGNYLDLGTATAASGNDPAMATVAKIHRSENRRRQN